MGRTAENLLETRSISRQAQDEFAFQSQQKAARAQAQGLFEHEIAPVSIPQRKGDPIIVGRDEFIKPNTSLEVLSQLKPAFKDGGSVTAGNASGLNDGSAALLIGSAAGLNRFGIAPLTRICSSAVAGVEPRIMGIGPVPASQLALKRAGLSLNDMDVIEINEAFAAQVLSVMADLGLDFNDNRVNPNGGAIALGHPLGMSGARLLLTASLELQRRKARYALCTMCIGVGQGYAVVLENMDL
jgi:acetyl-CoA acetyltransferase family protein